MIILSVLDEKGGMLFNRRRQSQDSKLREYILSMIETTHIWMDQYTAKQFVSVENKSNLIIDDNFLDKAQFGDYCFVEDKHVSPYLDKIEKIILFRWNRKYPGDFFFDIDVPSEQWMLVNTEEFQGSSHEKITKEVYIKK